MTNKPEGVEAGVPPDHARDVLERVSDAVVALDRNWRYIYVNPQAAALFGRRPEDLIGRHIWTEFPEGVGQPFQLAYQNAPWRSRSSSRWRTTTSRGIAGSRTVSYPSPEGLSIFFHEITERKRAEQAAREKRASARRTRTRSSS